MALHRDQDNPTTIILIEKRASRAKYETYNCRGTEKGDLDTLSNLLQSSPKRCFFDHLLL